MLLAFVLVYSLFSFLFLRTLYKFGLKFIYIIPAFWIIDEMLSTYFYIYDSGGTINLLTFLFIIYAIIKLGIIKLLKANIFVYIFLLIAYVNVPFRDDILSFTNRYMNLFNIYMILPISIVIAQKSQDFNLFKVVLKNTLIITVLYIIISSFFKLGPNMYDTGLIFGLKWSQFYGPAIAAVFLITFFRLKRNKFNTLIFDNSLFIVSLTMIIITFLTLRRTAILIVLLYIFSYILFTINPKKIVYFLLISFILFISITILDDYISLNRSDRGIVLSKDYDITREGRYYDIFGVLDQMKYEERLLNGYELFNEYGNYGAKRDTRPIHVDLMRIFYGVGIVGIIPLFLIFFKMGQLIIKIKPYSRELFAISISTLCVFILTLFTGGTLYISYGGLAFIILGNSISKFSILNRGNIN